MVKRKNAAIAITDGAGRRAVFLEGQAKLLGTAKELRLGLLSNIERDVLDFGCQIMNVRFSKSFPGKCSLTSDSSLSITLSRFSIG